MIAYLNGILAGKGQNECVIETGGVGFSLLCSMNTVQNLPETGSTIKIYTFLNVREDALELFGFYSAEERAMFLRLITVSGIGARTALAILGSMPLKELTVAIVTGDAVTLARAPGVGKKTAQRIALELKDKISAEDIEDLNAHQGTAAVSQNNDARSEAVLALQALGYTAGEAARAVAKVQTETDRPDELVRQALRHLF